MTLHRRLLIVAAALTTIAVACSPADDTVVCV